MNLDKAQTKKILFIVAATIFMLWIALHYDVALAIISYVIGILLPLIFGLCIAFILNVLMKFFENRVLIHITKRTDIESRKGRIWKKALRPTSIFLTLIALAGIITFVVSMILPSLEKSISLIIAQAPHIVKLGRDWIDHLLAHFGLDMTMASIDEIKQLLNGYDEGFFDKIVQFLSGTGSAIAMSVAGIAGKVFSTVTNVFFGFIFSMYILATKETLGRQMKHFMSAVFSEKKAKQILEVGRIAQHIFERFVSGQCIEAVIIGTLTALGSLLINPSYAVMLGVLVGFTALIPVIGAFLGVIVGALLLVMVSPWQALAFIIFIIVLQHLENNFIYPKVVGKSIGLPGMWVFFAVLAGGTVYGIVGIIIGVPLVSVIYSLTRSWTHNRLRKKYEASELQDLEDIDDCGPDDLIELKEISDSSESTDAEE